MQRLFLALITRLAIRSRRLYAPCASSESADRRVPTSNASWFRFVIPEHVVSPLGLKDRSCSRLPNLTTKVLSDM
jgi:hypothetical protein